MVLRNRIVLQSSTIQTFKGGCKTVTWNTVNTYWANVKEVGGGTFENVKGQQNTNVDIIMRDFLDIDRDSYRFTFNDRVINIISINDPANRNNFITIKGVIEENG